MTSAEFREYIKKKPTAATPAAVGICATVGHPNARTVVFTGRVPGNNGEGGLLRMHWSRRQKLLSQYEWVVAAARLERMPGPVRLELVRYSTGCPMDYDNLVSTGKLLVDALVRCGVLPDDTPAVIAERVYRQERAAGKGYQRTEIILTPLNPNP